MLPLVRIRHTRTYFLREPSHNVPLILKDAMDPVLVRNIFLQKACTFRDFPWNPSSYAVDRISVRVKNVLSPEDR
jgi:hypothetical protein